jgi:hypothetical protein
MLTGAASLAASLCSQLPEAHAVDAPVVTDRVYLDVAVDNKILVRVPSCSPPQASLRPGPTGDMCSPWRLPCPVPPSLPALHMRHHWHDPTPPLHSNLPCLTPWASSVHGGPSRTLSHARHARIQGRIVIGLYGEASPVGAQRFKDLASNLQVCGDRRRHRILPHSWCGDQRRRCPPPLVRDGRM